MNEDRTPVIVGVGQFTERLNAPGYAALSPAEIAAVAAKAAVNDAAGTASLSPVDGILRAIDALGAVRTFEDSTSGPSAFGKPNNFPRSVARRLGIEPRLALLEKAGGQSPVSLLADLADRIAQGVIGGALAVGGEAISTVRHLKSTGAARDWSDLVDANVEDHGRGTLDFMTRYNLEHGLVGAAPAYALLENARRARLGMSRASYARLMGELFAPFTQVAASNPYSSAAIGPMSVEKIITVDDSNRLVSDPYPVKLVARDQVNQGAAVLLMAACRARELGIRQEKFIYLHGCALATEKDIPVRPDLSVSPAAAAALKAALVQADVSIADIALFDFYSCFPIAVFAAAVDALGLSPTDARGFTVTGGLPYFGGAGNNYSMHAIASMTERLRDRRGAYGLVGANGGFLSKYGALVLSTKPREWRGGDNPAIQATLDAVPSARLLREANGPARIVTYTVTYQQGKPTSAIIVGELACNGCRFLANDADGATLQQMVTEDSLGEAIHVVATPRGNRFAFDAARVDRLRPRPPAFRPAYQYILIEREHHILEVTINRPEVRNCLSPEAHDELAEVFDAYEADADLWVAILVGSGDKAFCAGADLRRATSGQPSWLPQSGFAGLTSRVTRVKPVIAAVNGIAFGGGFETCLAADLVVADPQARFALTEVKLGLIAAMGGAVRLPRQLPRKVAVELLLTGREIAVDEAMRLGFVNRVSKPGEVLSEARKLAAEIAAQSPTAVRLTMKAIHEADQFADAGEAAIAALESGVMDELIFSEDMAEGLAAFGQRRPPLWKNR